MGIRQYLTWWKAACLTALVALVSLVAFTFFGAPKAQAIPPEQYLISEWVVYHYSIGDDPVIIADPPGSPGNFEPPNEEEGIRSLFFRASNQQIANTTTYNLQSGGGTYIEVDNCSTNSTSARYFSFATADDPGTPITLGGAANLPCIEDEPEENGALDIVLFFDRFNELIQETSIGPIRVDVLNEQFDLVESQLDENGVYEQGDDSISFFTNYPFTVGPGTYRVEVFEGDVLVGEESNIRVDAGVTTTVSVTINERGGGINQVQFSDKSVKSPCTGNFLSIGWMLCQAVQALFNGIEFLYQRVVLVLLDIQPLQERGPDGERTELFNIWSNIRVLANISFIIIFLVAIFGAATGWLFNNYELKKLIPRLFIGVVAAQISWFIVAFIVDAGNVLGGGIRGLLLSPAESLPVAGLQPGLFNNVDALSVFGVWVDNLLLALGAFAIFNSAITFKGLVFALPLILTPIIVAVIIVVFVLALRHVLIAMLAVASPIVLILWSLPGTDGIIKQWWELFWKLIIMYPLIIALIAGGELVSKLIIADRSENPIYIVLGVSALFAPFFLIPATFSFAGSALANAASGFDGIKKGVNQRLYGSSEPGARGGYIGRVKDYNESVRQQQSFRNLRRASSFTKQARQAAGLPDQGVGLRGLRDYRNYGKLARYGAYHMRPRNLLGTVNRANQSFAARTALTKTDSRMAQRTIAAKKMFNNLTEQQQDYIAHAAFGNKNIFTGEALPEWAITEAKEYRADQAAQNTLLRYLVSQAVTGEDMQKLMNHYSQWNPYTDPSITLDKGEVMNADKHAAAGHKKDFEIFEAGKIGILKGATFGTQRERKDGKNRTLKPKTDSYIAARGEKVWGRSENQAVSEANWQDYVDANPEFARPDVLGEGATEEQQIEYRAQQKKHDDEKKRFMEREKRQFTEDYFEDNKGNFGRINDGSLKEAIGEVNYGMEFTGQQLGSMFEMMSEAAHRMDEVDEHFDDLVELSVAQLEIDEDDSLSDEQKKRRKNIAKQAKQAQIGNVDPIAVNTTYDEKIEFASRVLGKDKAKTNLNDYKSLDQDQKNELHREKLKRWHDDTIAEVQRSRNLAIDVLESGALSRAEEAGDDGPAIQTETAQDLYERRPWRINELENLKNYEASVIGKADPDKLREIEAEARNEVEAEVSASGVTVRSDDMAEQIARRTRDKAKEEFENFKTRSDADQLIKEAKRAIHKDRVNEILGSHQTPYATLEQVQESMDFIRMSNWIEDRGYGDE